MTMQSLTHAPTEGQSLVPLRADDIPEDLKTVARWTAWRLTMRGQRPTKEPVNPWTGHNASSTDPHTWAPFDVALHRYETNSLDGLMFALGTGYAGVDIDKCRDRNTGEISADARAMVTDLDSYTEISPSGTGLKVFMRGVLPPDCRRKGQVEMYDAGRLFTMTGYHLGGTPVTVEERTSQLAALHRSVFGDAVTAVAAQPHVWTSVRSGMGVLRERATRGRIRRTTLTLLDTTGAASYSSASEADAAIAAALIGAGLTRDEALALLLDSARGQDAIRRKSQRHGLTYLQRTVAHAADFVGPVVVQADGRRTRPARTPRHRSVVSLPPREGTHAL